MARGDLQTGRTAPEAAEPGSRPAGAPPSAFTGTAVRNSPWVAISILLHVILIAIMSVVYVHQHFRKDDTAGVEVNISDRPRSAEEKLPEVEELIERRPIPKNEEAEVTTFVEALHAPMSQPSPDEDLKMKIGDPNMLTEAGTPGMPGGTAMGVGKVGHYGERPSPFSSRKLGQGGGKGRGAGATQGTEEAVLYGLRWLLRHQEADGSWRADTMPGRCGKLKGRACAQSLAPRYNEGLTGLALLAFLGAGYTHESRQTMVDPVGAKRYRLSDVVKAGLQWLMRRQKPDGSFTEERPYLYNEALATLALCEAYGLTGTRILQEPAQRAVDFLVAAQKQSPEGAGPWGWRYTARPEIEARMREGGQVGADELNDADTSVTAWVVMALKSADLSGLKVPQETFDGAMAFIDSVIADGGLVGYRLREGAGNKVTGSNDHYDYHEGSMSALAMCARMFIQKNAADPFLEDAARVLAADLPKASADKLSIDYYFWYYATLALNQFDGPDSPRKGSTYWGPWNQAMNRVLIPLQDRTEDACSHGGWLIQDRWSHSGGAIYATAVNVLTLEVYYRYENAFGGAKRR